MIIVSVGNIATYHFLHCRDFCPIFYVIHRIQHKIILCDVNEIDFIQQYRSRRATTILASLKAFIIDSTLGQRDILSSSTDFMKRIYFPLIDSMLVELNDRFSSKTLSLMKSISTVYPESKNFLNINGIDEFSHHIDTDSNGLKIEFIVIKSMLQSKTINDVVGFLNEIIPKGEKAVPGCSDSGSAWRCPLMPGAA